MAECSSSLLKLFAIAQLHSFALYIHDSLRSYPAAHHYLRQHNFEQLFGNFSSESHRYALWRYHQKPEVEALLTRWSFGWRPRFLSRGNFCTELNVINLHIDDTPANMSTTRLQHFTSLFLFPRRVRLSTLLESLRSFEVAKEWTNAWIRKNKIGNPLTRWNEKHQQMSRFNNSRRTTNLISIWLLEFQTKFNWCRKHSITRMASGSSSSQHAPLHH